MNNRLLLKSKLNCLLVMTRMRLFGSKKRLIALVSWINVTKILIVNKIENFLLF